MTSALWSLPTVFGILPTSLIPARHALPGLTDNGKLVVRRGRKATGPRRILWDRSRLAGLPNETRSTHHVTLRLHTVGPCRPPHRVHALNCTGSSRGDAHCAACDRADQCPACCCRPLSGRPPGHTTG